MSGERLGLAGCGAGGVVVAGGAVIAAARTVIVSVCVGLPLVVAADPE